MKEKIGCFIVLRQVRSTPNDVIQKIEKTLNNHYTITQKQTNNSFRNSKKVNTQIIGVIRVEFYPVLWHLVACLCK